MDNSLAFIFSFFFELHDTLLDEFPRDIRQEKLTWLIPLCSALILGTMLRLLSPITILALSGLSFICPLLIRYVGGSSWHQFDIEWIGPAGFVLIGLLALISVAGQMALIVIQCVKAFTPNALPGRRLEQALFILVMLAICASTFSLFAFLRLFPATPYTDGLPANWYGSLFGNALILPILISGIASISGIAVTTISSRQVYWGSIAGLAGLLALGFSWFQAFTASHVQFVGLP